MNIELKRFSKDETTTLGLLFIDDKFECFTLEDKVREAKIRSVTAIPEGTYDIRFREVASPKTKQYRRRFEDFVYHLELQDVPNYKYVYIHVGNDHFDTDGCILVGDGVQSLLSASDKLSSSTVAFRRLYKKISQKLLDGARVQITIKDI